MSNPAHHYVGGRLLRQNLICLPLLLALSFSQIDAEAATCRMNYRNGQNEFPLNVGTVEVPPPHQPYHYFWRSPLQRVQVVCESLANELPDVPLVIQVHPTGRHLPELGVDVGIAVEYEGRTSTSDAPYSVDTGYRIKAGVATTFALEYRLRFWSYASVGQHSGVIVKQFPLLSIRPSYHQRESPNEYFLTQMLNGKFVPRSERTCALSVNSGSGPVKLPVLSIGSLSRESPAAGRVHFDLALSNCGAAVSRANFTFSGQAAPGNVNYFANQGTSSGVALHLGLQQNNQTISPQGPSQMISVTVEGQLAKLPMFAQYHWIDEVTAGTFGARAVFVLSYE